MLREVELLTDQVVAGVVGVVRVELHHRAEDVRGGLVEAAGLARVGQVGGVLGDAVAHLVAGHVQRDQRAEVHAVAVAVRHLGAVPERVDVARAVVHPARRAGAVAEDAVAAVHELEVVERLRAAVRRVDAGRLAVAGGAVAEGQVGAGEHRPVGAAGPEDLAQQRVRPCCSCRRWPSRRGSAVLEQVAAAGLGHLDRHGAAVQRLAGALGGLDLLLGAQDRAGGGVDVRRQPRGVPSDWVPPLVTFQASRGVAPVASTRSCGVPVVF